MCGFCPLPQTLVHTLLSPLCWSYTMGASGDAASGSPGLWWAGGVADRRQGCPLPGTVCLATAFPLCGLRSPRICWHGQVSDDRQGLGTVLSKWRTCPHTPQPLGAEGTGVVGGA